MYTILLKAYLVILLHLGVTIGCADLPSNTTVQSKMAEPTPSVPATVEAADSLALIAGAVRKEVALQPVQARATKNTDTLFYTSALGLRPNGQDQTTDIIRILSDLPVGATLNFDTETAFTVSSPITIRKPVRLITSKAAINYTGPAGSLIFNIKSSDVTIRGFLISAPYGTYVPNSFMVATSGSTNTNPYTNIEIRDCSLTGYRGVGINLRYVRGFRLVNNNISNMPYAGVACYSVIDGLIDGNNIRDITADSTNSKNAYGITIQQKSDDSVSNTIRISNNKITGIPWEGIDTHGGEYLYIINNEVKDCRVGIAMVSNRVKSPVGICIANNRVESRGTGKSSIQFDGRSPIQSATGLIANNKIIGQHIRLENTRNMLVYGNEIRESETGFGIYLNGYNYNSLILDNTIQDVWSRKSGKSYGIYFDKDSNSAIIDGNKLVSKNFSPPNGSKNKAAFKISDKSFTSNARLGNNDFGPANDRRMGSSERVELLSKKGGKDNERKSEKDYSDLEDGALIILDRFTDGEKLQLPVLNQQTSGHTYLVRNNTKKSIHASATFIRMAEPAAKTSVIPSNKTAILFYDYKNRTIWVL